MKFKVGSQQLLLAYQFDAKRNVIEVLDVGPHELLGLADNVGVSTFVPKDREGLQALLRLDEIAPGETLVRHS